MSEEVKTTTVTTDTTEKVSESAKESEVKAVAIQEEKVDAAEEKVEPLSIQLGSRKYSLMDSATAPPIKINFPAGFDFREPCYPLKLECHRCHREVEGFFNFQFPMRLDYKFRCRDCVY